MNTETTIECPEIVEEEHLVYLDDLQESGITNMYGAGTYLEREFFITRFQAKEILGYWMDSYNERHSQ